MASEFILHFEHEALKYIHGQHKLNTMHAEWAEYLRSFYFTIQHKSGKLNKGADALSRRYLFQLDACVLGVEHLQLQYSEDKDFGELYGAFQKHSKDDYLIQESFLFEGTCLCVPKCSTRELLIREVHSGSLAGHYGETKTLTSVKEHYF